MSSWADLWLLASASATAVVASLLGGLGRGSRFRSIRLTSHESSDMKGLSERLRRLQERLLFFKFQGPIDPPVFFSGEVIG